MITPVNTRDTLLCILSSNLDIKDLRNTSQVCQLWNQVSNTNMSWCHAYSTLGLPLPGQNEQISLKKRVKEFISPVSLALLHKDMKFVIGENSETNLAKYPVVSPELLVVLQSDDVSYKDKINALKEYLNSLICGFHASDKIMKQFSNGDGTIYAFDLLLELGIDIETYDILAHACNRFNADVVRIGLFLQHGAKASESALFNSKNEIDGHIWPDVTKLLKGTKPNSEIPKLSGDETDKELVIILYKMPRDMRNVILFQLRSRPDYQEIAPSLLANAGAHRINLCGKSLQILANAVREYFANQQ